MREEDSSCDHSSVSPRCGPDEVDAAAAAAAAAADADGVMGRV